MQGKSIFEIILGTVLLFLFLTIVAFVASMSFFSLVVNSKDQFRDSLMALCAFLLTGLIMGFFAVRLRTKYQAQQARGQVWAFNVYLVILALIVFGFDSFLLYRDPRMFKKEINYESPADFLEENFDKMVDSSGHFVDSATLRSMIRNLRDTAYRGWTWIHNEENFLTYRYPPYPCRTNSTYQIIDRKKYRIINNKIIPDGNGDPNKGYSVSVIYYDWEKAGESPDKLFERQKEYLVQATNGVILQDLEVKKGNYTGRQFYVDMPAMKLKSFTQVFLAHSRIYICTVITDYDHLFNHSISKFLNGVEIEKQ